MNHIDALKLIIPDDFLELIITTVPYGTSECPPSQPWEYYIEDY